MKAISLPQPWAGRVLAGQIRAINAPIATDYRGELAIFAQGYDSAVPRAGDILTYRRLFITQPPAYLGFVHVQGVADTHQTTISPYLGHRWFWTVTPGDLLMQPVDDPAFVPYPFSVIHMVPDRMRDAIDSERLGWSVWWDRALLAR